MVPLFTLSPVICRCELMCLQAPDDVLPAPNSCTVVNLVGSIMTVIPYFGWAGMLTSFPRLSLSDSKPCSVPSMESLRTVQP